MSVGTDGPRKIWNFHAVEWLKQPFRVYFSEKFQQSRHEKAEVQTWLFDLRVRPVMIMVRDAVHTAPVHAPI